MTFSEDICFTVDLEDWYQGLELPFHSWPQYEKRVEIGMNRLMDLLSIHNCKATFFVLGWIAENYPEMIRRLTKEGHELASHGYSHEKVYDLSKEAFREDIRKTKAIIEDISNTEVIAYRAPFFSITKDSLWALPILAEEGYKIDCSISPVKTWRYGIANCPDEIFKFRDIDLIEFPVSSFNFLKRKWAIGGAYFRLFPAKSSNFFINKRLKGNKETMFYIHPWEYDEDHPVIEMEKKAKFTHYTNLKKTYNNTDKLLSRFNFKTVNEIIESKRVKSDLKSYQISFFE